MAPNIALQLRVASEIRTIREWLRAIDGAFRRLVPVVAMAMHGRRSVAVTRACLRLSAKARTSLKLQTVGVSKSLTRSAPRRLELSRFEESPEPATILARILGWCRLPGDREGSLSIKEEQSWVTREARTKARENSRRRPSKLPRKNDKRREKRRISKFPLLSARSPIAGVVVQRV